MTWRKWSSEAAFDPWHADAMSTLGIPHPGRNQATGEVDESAAWTTAYTEVVQVATNDWRAPVGDDVAELVPDGLGTPCNPPPSPDEP